jgi:hypothetical protein
MSTIALYVFHDFVFVQPLWVLLVATFLPLCALPEVDAAHDLLRTALLDELDDATSSKMGQTDKGSTAGELAELLPSLFEANVVNKFQAKFPSFGLALTDLASHHRDSLSGSVNNAILLHMAKTPLPMLRFFFGLAIGTLALLRFGLLLRPNDHLQASVSNALIYALLILVLLLSIALVTAKIRLPRKQNLPPMTLSSPSTSKTRQREILASREISFTVTLGTEEIHRVSLLPKPQGRDTFHDHILRNSVVL